MNTKAMNRNDLKLAAKIIDLCKSETGEITEDELSESLNIPSETTKKVASILMNLGLMDFDGKDYRHHVKSVEAETYVDILREGNIKGEEIIESSGNYDFVTRDKEGKIHIYDIRWPGFINSGSYSQLDRILERGKKEFAGSEVDLWVVYKSNDGKLTFCLYKDNTLSHNETFMKVSSFQDVLTKITEITESHSNSFLFFRGSASVSFKEEPGIYRNQNMKCLENEDEMFSEVERRCCSDFPNTMSVFAKLAKMQHYGLPTRLLDVTQNLLVALYFACRQDNAHKDEVGMIDVYIVQKNEVKRHDDREVALISSLAKCPYKSFQSDEWKNELKAHSGMADVTDDEVEAVSKKILFVLPELNNERIKIQSGAFILFGASHNKEMPKIKSYECVRFYIDNKVKRQIIQQLKIMGISDSILFPELEICMKDIKSQFM